MAFKSTQQKRNAVAEYANDKGIKMKNWKKEKRENPISFDGWARRRRWCFD